LTLYSSQLTGQKPSHPAAGTPHDAVRKVRLMQNTRLHVEPSGNILPLIKATTQKVLALCLGATALCGFAAAQTPGTYTATNLLSDGSVTATTTDPNFINPWGVSIGPAFWINTQATGFDYVVTAAGTIPFKVTIPSATGVSTTPGTPTGTVFTGSTTGFKLPDGSPATFLFSSLDGAITGWNSALGTTNSIAQIAINNSANNAVYTDMALLTNPTGTFILAANFGQGTDIEVYDSNFAAAKLAGNFTDPNLPANYAPFAVHVIGSQVFVTYALRTVSTPSAGGSSPVTSSPYAVRSSAASPKAMAGTTYLQTVGAGNGVVDVFDLNGNFVSRAVTNGNLNAPWGVAIAPAGFGIFGGDLLIGNFGDGIINVYNPTTFAFLGQLTDGTGKALSYPSLWEITFGESNATPAGAGDPNTLYIAAGLANEAHGLFAAIANSTTSTAAATFGFSASTSTASVTPGGSTQATISVAPTNSFSGSVNLSCTAPSTITCTFSPSTINASPMASATSTVTIQTTAASSAHLQPNHLGAKDAASIIAAMLLPFGSFLAFSRKRASGKGRSLHLLGLLILLVVSAGAAVGCSSSMPMASAVSTPSTPSTPGTPAGVQTVTITATSGSITQNTTIALTVQ
jgi:hypothetical protein